MHPTGAVWNGRIARAAPLLGRKYYRIRAMHILETNRWCTQGALFFCHGKVQSDTPTSRHSTEIGIASRNNLRENQRFSETRDGAWRHAWIFLDRFKGRPWVYQQRSTTLPRLCCEQGTENPRKLGPEPMALRRHRREPGRPCFSRTGSWWADCLHLVQRTILLVGKRSAQRRDQQRGNTYERSRSKRRTLPFTRDERGKDERLDKFSDWSRAVIGIAALQQLIRRKTNRNKTDSTRLTTDDKSKARTTIIKMVQGESFIEEIKELTDSRNDEAVKFHSQLYKLDPFLHKDGTMPVGGRLKHVSSLHYDVKHPIILPRRSYITNLIVKDCHEKVEHQGRGMTVNEIRARGFWVVGISSAVSSHIHRCVQCKKLRAQTLEQKMANLPEERVEPSAPFTFCGYDCFGPFIIKEGRKELKKYGLLFTCMSSRAVHIEALDDMSTDAFLNALRCFIALCGRTKMLHCGRTKGQISLGRITN